MGFVKFSFIAIQKCHENILDPRASLAPEKVGRQLYKKKESDAGPHKMFIRISLLDDT